MDPKILRYAKSHEWTFVQGETATIGITQFAVDLLTDLTHVELPKVGRTVSAGTACGEIESVKAVSDIYAPIDGEISAINHEVVGNLELITADPYGQGWLFKMKVKPDASLDHLMDLPQYEEHVKHDQH
jgi:glycine cleavage system H protein